MASSKVINFRGIRLEFERGTPGGWSVYKRPKPLCYYAVSPKGAVYSTQDGTVASAMRLIKTELTK